MELILVYISVSILKKTENQDDIYIPCDGVILEGFCTVNESDLTGENTLVLKNAKHHLNLEQVIIFFAGGGSSLDVDG